MQVLAEGAVSRFQEIVGKDNVKLSSEDLSYMGRDWTTDHPACPTAILLPASTQEVQQIMQYCWQENIKVVPSGGRTGLVGGAVAAQGEVVVSLSRLQKILEINSVGMYAIVEAGVTTQTLQEQTDQHGVMFGLNLAARGSSHIGGNISTNAGGTKFIRYGAMREQVLGLEVVLANGELLSLSSSLRKNNTGYDLKQLFIGSEGTLGIVTQATLKLVSKSKAPMTMCFAVNDFDHILQMLEMCNLRTPILNAFEFFSNTAYRTVLETQKNKPLFSNEADYYALIELEGDREDVDSLVSDIFSRELAEDGIVAQSASDHKMLWHYRDQINEALTVYKVVKKGDVSIPIPQLGNFLRELQDYFHSQELGDIKMVMFGHIGDGNLHIDYASQDLGRVEQINAIDEKMHRMVGKYGGSVSAEHGIGLRKRKFLPFTRSEAEIEMMRTLKKSIDPRNILNPDKIFTL